MSLFETYVTANPTDTEVVNYTSKYESSQNNQPTYARVNYHADYFNVLQSAIESATQGMFSSALTYVHTFTDLTDLQTQFVLADLCTSASKELKNNGFYYFTIPDENSTQSFQLYISADTEAKSYTITNNTAVILTNNKTKLDIIHIQDPKFNSTSLSVTDYTDEINNRSLVYTSSSTPEPNQFSYDTQNLYLNGPSDFTTSLQNLVPLKKVKFSVKATTGEEFSIYLNNVVPSLSNAGLGPTYSFVLDKQTVLPTGFTLNNNASFIFKTETFTKINYTLAEPTESTGILSVFNTVGAVEFTLNSQYISIETFLDQFSFLSSVGTLNTQLGSIYDALGTTAAMMDNLDTTFYLSGEPIDYNQYLAWDYTVRTTGSSTYFSVNSGYENIDFLVPPVAKITSYEVVQGNLVITMYVGLPTTILEANKLGVDLSPTSDFESVVTDYYSLNSTTFSGTRPNLVYTTPVVSGTYYFRLNNDNVSYKGRSFTIIVN